MQALASPTRVVSAIVTLLLPAPPVAIAQAPQTNAPAGNSGVEDYPKAPPAAGGGGLVLMRRRSIS